LLRKRLNLIFEGSIAKRKSPRPKCGFLSIHLYLSRATCPIYSRKLKKVWLEKIFNDFLLKKKIVSSFDFFELTEIKISKTEKQKFRGQDLK